MPRIMPEPRYFSMPSIEVGAEVFRNRALNCWPWVRSLTHSPDAVTHSPAEITAAWPMTVISSRWPRALIRSTQKPFSALWKVTRSTRPAKTSWDDWSGRGFMPVVALSKDVCISTTHLWRGASHLLWKLGSPGPRHYESPRPASHGSTVDRLPPLGFTADPRRPHVPLP